MPPKKKLPAKKTKAKPKPKPKTKSKVAVKAIKKQTTTPKAITQSVRVNVNVHQAKKATSKQRTKNIKSSVEPFERNFSAHFKYMNSLPTREVKQLTQNENINKRLNDLELLKHGTLDDLFNSRSSTAKLRGADDHYGLYDELDNNTQSVADNLNSKTLHEYQQASESGRTGTEFDATEDNLDTRSQRSNSSADSMRTAHSLDKLLRTIEERDQPEQDTSGLRRLLKPESPLPKPPGKPKRNAKGQFSRP
jgi:hypothetical protein